MKEFFQTMLLFLALFFTGVDAKAIATDEDKLTVATAWVDKWEETAYVYATGPVSQFCPVGVSNHLLDFSKKVKKTLAGAYFSYDDLLHLQDAAVIAGNVVRQKNCADYIPVISFLKQDIEKRLEKKKS
jgi:hypothetical protein